MNFTSAPSGMPCASRVTVTPGKRRLTVLVRKEELLDEMSSRVRNYDGRRGGADYLRAISQDIDVLLDFMG